MGINPYGSWDCSSNRTIPVWAEKNQVFCQATPKVSPPAVEKPKVTEPVRQSIWDVLNDAPQQAPVEEAQPAN